MARGTRRVQRLPVAGWEEMKNRSGKKMCLIRELPGQNGGGVIVPLRTRKTPYRMQSACGGGEERRKAVRTAGTQVNLSAEETVASTFLRSDWPRPFARREVGVEMELGRSENKRPEQSEILN
ncbi:hypothetical protein TNCV_733181 [Trichonephila clavipes]|nr:hypothetical protein TNCV_733181 [Trichonephila clavipes]